MSAGDRRFMDHALGLGRRGLGRTWPNPAVGCVIVRHEEDVPVIVGRGWTARGGRPHAEARALAQAGADARGATAYVTLEPCAHSGKTPPCAGALIDAGIARVVSALADPDPRVSGAGHQALRDAGVSVQSGVGAADARLDQAGFLSRMEKGRPHVHLKLAISRDGKIAPPDRRTVQITGERVRAHVHMMRARHDAVLIGITTALADDPQLTCRLPGLEDWSPVRIVLDSRLRLPAGTRLLATLDQAPLWIFCASAADAGRIAKLEDAGASVITGASGQDGRLDLPAVMEMLARRGLTRLMVEGGGRVAGALLRAHLVDEITLFRAGHDLGADAIDAVEGFDLSAITGSANFRLLDKTPLGADTMFHYWRNQDI